MKYYNSIQKVAIGKKIIESQKSGLKKPKLIENSYLSPTRDLNAGFDS